VVQKKASRERGLFVFEDRPPLGVTELSGLQHVGIIAIALVYALILNREAGLSFDQTSDVLEATMLILGLGAIKTPCTFSTAQMRARSPSAATDSACSSRQTSSSAVLT
jgi:hypothetical protein